MAAFAIKSSAVRWMLERGIMMVILNCHHPRRRMIQ
jgi:hypothetical protein